MRPFLILVVISTCAFGQLPEGAGPQPPVTAKYVPEFINEAMRDVMRDPPALYYRRWTQPELRTVTEGKRTIGWWSMEITVIGNNGYKRHSGAREQTFRITIENLRVTRIVAVDASWD